MFNIIEKDFVDDVVPVAELEKDTADIVTPTLLMAETVILLVAVNEYRDKIHPPNERHPLLIKTTEILEVEDINVWVFI